MAIRVTNAIRHSANAGLRGASIAVPQQHGDPAKGSDLVDVERQAGGRARGGSPLDQASSSLWVPETRSGCSVNIVEVDVEAWGGAGNERAACRQKGGLLAR